jgi:hypothetical protein
MHTALVVQLRDWLGRTGIAHFRKIKAEHGEINTVWMEGGIPHSVHFREGMQVRNKLRELTNNTWSSHEYDDRWIGLIEEAIKETP